MFYDKSLEMRVRCVSQNHGRVIISDGSMCVDGFGLPVRTDRTQL